MPEHFILPDYKILKNDLCDTSVVCLGLLAMRETSLGSRLSAVRLMFETHRKLGSENNWNNWGQSNFNQPNSTFNVTLTLII